MTPEEKEKAILQTIGRSAQGNLTGGGSYLGRVQFIITASPVGMLDPVLLRIREKYAIPQHLLSGWSAPVNVCILPSNDCETPTVRQPQTHGEPDGTDDGSYRVEQQVTQYRTYPKGGSYPVCPRCNADIDREYMHFCNCCGQRLSWERFPEW